MQNKVALLVAVLLGLVALAGIHSYVKKKELEYRGDSNTVTVLVAKNDIAVHEELTEDMVEKKEVPEEYLPVEHIKPSDLHAFLGQALQEPVKAGQYLLTAYFRLGSERSTVEARITPGKRAMTIRVDDVTGLSGLLRPGCYVDVVGTFDVELKYLEGGETRNTDTVTKTMTLVRRKPVLAVGSSLRVNDNQENPYADPADSYASVTLEVSPEEAQTLSFAQSKGQLSLVLRNKDDMNDPKTPLPPIDMETMIRNAGGGSLGGAESGPPKMSNR